jgi:DNA polymerase-3 subunit epsilon/ATP-dependent DNA helicase DinG
MFVALDLETTGLDAARDSIIEVGAVRFRGNSIVDTFSTLVNPLRPIPRQITELTGIRTADVADAPTMDRVVPELLAFAGSDTAGVVAHNAAFDLGFLRAVGVNFHRPAFDTLELASILLPGLASYSLGELCRVLEIPLVDAHRALDDAQASALLFALLQERSREQPPALLRLILESARTSDWPLTPFFAAAAEFQEIQDRPSVGATLADRLATGNGAPLVEEAIATPVSGAAVDAFFAADGDLAQHLGTLFERRTGQVDMAGQIAQAFNDGDHLLVEAGTGTGKSLAYLLPAALWALQNGQRVVIATNTLNLQDQLLEKEIPQVQALLTLAGYPAPQAALLKGRQNYLCARRLHAWRHNQRLSPAELTLLAKVLVWLPTTTTGDLAELALSTPAEKAAWLRICSDAASCTLERCSVRGTAESEAGALPWHDYYLAARARAERAHLVIVNHALLLADLATEGRVLPPYRHLIVDETHRLEEAATDQLTYRVEWPAVETLLRRWTGAGDLAAQLHRAASARRMSAVVQLLPELAAQAQRVAQMLAALTELLGNFARQQDAIRADAGYAQRVRLDDAARSQPYWSRIEIEWDACRDELFHLVELVAWLGSALAEARWPDEETTIPLYADVLTAHTTLDELGHRLDEILLAPHGARPGQVTWLEVAEGKPVVLALAPVAVQDLIEAGLVRSRRTAIFTGATLRTGSGFRYLRERLGLWDVKIATVDSPFDYKHNVLLYLPSDMPLPNQPQYQQALEQAIVAAACANGGRTLVLFTSHQQLRTTADAIHTSLERAGITLLQHGQTSRFRLLREFRSREQAVLLGTRSFWEGVDLPGDELTCLLIARLPFAVPSDPLVAARSAEFDDPFQEYMVPDAVLRLRQGFGRLVRRSTDRGVVVLLDSRAWRRDYGQAFLDALPECTVRRAPLANLGAAVQGWRAARPRGMGAAT